jgi:hypothetical protein
MPSAAPKKIWFPAKRIGWGWGPPVCWQGWVVMGVWLAVLVPLVTLLGEPARGIAVLAESVVLVAVCWWKGEPPRWRWGGK